MSDISEIVVNGTTYNVKDTTARSSGGSDNEQSGGSSADFGWKLINEITVSEATDTVNITTDSDGNSFSYHDVLAVLYVQATDSGKPLVYIPNGIWSSGNYCNADTKLPTGYFGNYVFNVQANENMFIGHSIQGGGSFCESPSGVKNANRHQITSFKFCTQGTTFIAGSVFKLFGRG